LVPLVKVLPADHRSTACDADDHDRCWHIGAQGLNLLRVREPRGFVELCPCSCHDACPITASTPADDLEIYAACICADYTDLVTRWRARRETDEAKDRHMKEAVGAVVANLDGPLDKAQARAALQAELSSRGTAVSEWQLDVMADIVVANKNTHGRNLAALRIVGRISGHVGQTIWRALRDSRRG
jgi:hypothetical protein